ncbi:MAG: site-specific integrase [Prevotella sp.]|nr:site-specific integrase [Prevotella sp.]
MKSTFSIIYYLKRQVVKRDGTVPVMGRITIDGTQTQFSCKLTVNPKLWDTKTGRMTGKSEAALETNRMLDKMRVSINKHYQEIMDRDNCVTAEKVKNAFLGLEYRCHTLLQVFKQHNNDYAKLVAAGMRAKNSFVKYQLVYKYLQEFLNIRYHVKDIALKELTSAFITDFEMYLRTDRQCKINTACLYISALRAMITIAMNNEWLVRDPFREYKAKKEETPRAILTKEELHLLMNTELKKKRQQLYRDLYVFCAFTGLAYIDLKNLREDNIHVYFDEHEWININRHKTGVEANIRLLDVPKRIMEKYRGVCKDGHAFPVPPYDSCLRGIKRIAKICGITKKVNWHQSRHTAATTVFLSNGVPIETVSSMLGHKNIKTTQIYAKITKEKQNRDMERLAAKLDSIEEFANCNI